MKILRVSVLMSLAMVVGADVWAQSQAPAPLSNRERIKLCKQKRNVPLEPAEYEPLHIDEDEGTVSKPKVIHQVSPGFSGPGTVVLEAVIDEDGCVRQTRVFQSAGKRVDAEAVKAVERWVFLPATVDGRPVRAYYAVTVVSEFRASGG